MTVDLKTITLDTCSICLEEMDQAEDTQKLKCAHLFHEACIGAWFKNAPTCPLCRIKATDLTPMPRPPEMTFSELMAVPDHQPHIPAQQYDEEFYRMTFAERALEIFEISQADIFARVRERLRERVTVVAQPIFNLDDLNMEHLVMPLPLRTRILLRIQNSPVGRSFVWIGNHFRSIRGNDA